MDWQTEFSKEIKNIFQNHKKRNPRFSLRSFAKKLEISVGDLSEIIQGKRNVKKARAEEILRRALTQPEDFARACAKIGWPVNIDRGLIQVHQMSFLTDWVSHAVMGYFEIDNPKIDAPWIGSKLGVATSEIESRIEQFIREGFLEKDSEGRVKIKLRGRQYHVPGSLPPELLTKFKQQQLIVAGRALEKANPEDSFFSSMTFLGTREQVEQFKVELKALYDRLAASVDPTQEPQLMRISVQAFPFEFKN